MDEVKRIELHTTHKDEKVIHKVNMKKNNRLKFFGTMSGGILAFIIIIILLIVFGVVLPAQGVMRSAKQTSAQAKITFDAIKKQNVELASQELIKTQVSFDKTKKDLQNLAYLKAIPFASWYYNDAEHLMNAGGHGLKAAMILVDSIKPYADVLGLKGQGSFVLGSAEDRIKTAVLTMGKITPRIDDIAVLLNAVREEIDKVDQNHYPAVFGGEKIKAQLVQVKSITDQGVDFVNQARPLIKVLPSLLGESKERKYLVLFQNDKELRPTGGFITAYAIFQVDKGIIHVQKSDDIYNLDNAIARKPVAPDPILKYLPKVPSLNLRDSNLSPDFIESMKTFNSLYDLAKDRVAVDGIIALDTSVLVSTIKILDDKIDVGGMTFTTKEDKRCSCPQVIYELENQISRPVNYKKTGRKDLLGVLLYAIMEKALRSSPKVYWGPLFQDMIIQTQQKHVLFNLYNKDAQAGAEALNISGRILPFEGDYLHINDANMGGAKSNLYVTQAVHQKIDIANDGVITKSITITYKNPYPPSDCNLESGGLCLNATLRDWVRVYTPKGSILLDSQGSEVKVTASEDLGKTAFEGFLTVRPQGNATYTLKYRLPFKLKNGSTLPIFIQKQPGTHNNEYTISLNGRKVEKFPLLTDKKLVLKP